MALIHLIISFVNIHTMDNYINKLSCWYLEQRNLLVYDQIYNTSISKKVDPDKAAPTRTA